MFSVETVSAIGRRLDASIPQQNISSKVSAKLKNIGRTAKIAGFRPGKAPVKILEQYYGEQALREALGESLQDSFADAIDQQQLRVAGFPEFQIKSADLKADPVEYSATFEVYPDVAMGDLSAETIERAVGELTQEDLDKTIEVLRKQRQTFTLVDRAAQAHDQVTIDFAGKLDGEVFKGGEATDYPFTLAEGRMLPDFENAITGMKAGEEKSFDMTFPETYHGKDVAGKQVTFTVTVKKVEEPVLPELNAEFAKSIGSADGDVGKMLEEVRSNLAREMENRIKLRNKEAAMDLLAKLAQFDIPKALVDWEVESLMKQYQEDMQARGVKQAFNLPPELFAERAQKRVKLGLLVSDLVEKNKLDATADQIRATVESQALSYESPEEVIAWVYGSKERLQNIENLVVEDNVVNWVFAQVKVTDKQVTFSELMEKM